MNHHSNLLRLPAGLVLLSMICMVCGAVLAEEPNPAVQDEHAAHRQNARQDTRVVSAEYVVPDVMLQTEDGSPVRLRELLGGDRSVAVNFIFTSCTSICPVMTATTLQLQQALAGENGAPHFVSISIDPQVDSAPVLRAYAERYGARWTFLTGSSEDVAKVLRAFDAWRGSKGNHAALTLFHRAHEPRWTRVEGLAPAQTLVDVWRDTAS